MLEREEGEVSVVAESLLIQLDCGKYSISGVQVAAAPSDMIDSPTQVLPLVILPVSGEKKRVLKCCSRCIYIAASKLISK